MGSVFLYLYLADIRMDIIAIAFLLLTISFTCWIMILSFDFKKVTLINTLITFIPSLICILIFTLMPSEASLYTLAVSKISEQENMSETNKKIADLINIKLDEALEEENKR